MDQCTLGIHRWANHCTTKRGCVTIAAHLAHLVKSDNREPVYYQKCELCGKERYASYEWHIGWDYCSREAFFLKHGRGLEQPSTK